MPRREQLPLDAVRTDLLAIDELFVVRGLGDSDNYEAWQYEYEEKPDCCPVCSGKEIKVQNKFSRIYTDYIIEDNMPRIIDLKYHFYKYRCKNPDCGRVFQTEISFATVNDHVTHRLEDKIAELVIGGSSYEEISRNAFNNQLTRQAVGQIFVRWVHARNENRKTKGQHNIIGAITGNTDRDVYTMIFACKKEKDEQGTIALRIYVLDILLGVETDSIVASLRRYGNNTTHFILTDCNPTVYSAAKEALPKAVHIIPAELWVKLVRQDYVDYIQPSLRWLPYRNKMDLMLQQRPPDKEYTDPLLKRMFDVREGLEVTYTDYQNIVDKITDREVRWNINELDQIPEDMYDPVFREQMSATMIQYKEYREEIAREAENWEIVPETLLFQTDRLEELIRGRRTFSEEALQAAVLYSIKSDTEDPQDWQGVRIEEIIKKMSELHRDGRRRNNDYE